MSGTEAPEIRLEYGLPVLDVAPQHWHDAARQACDARAMTYFDWLSAVDEIDSIDVVAHLWAPATRAHLLLRTRLPASDPHLATLVDVYAGAAWHERETYEMFGVGFDGHPDLRPLLLPAGAPATPLRKRVALAEREPPRR